MKIFNPSTFNRLLSHISLRTSHKPAFLTEKSIVIPYQELHPNLQNIARDTASLSKVRLLSGCVVPLSITLPPVALGLSSTAFTAAHLGIQYQHQNALKKIQNKEIFTNTELNQKLASEIAGKTFSISFSPNKDLVVHEYN